MTAFSQPHQASVSSLLSLSLTELVPPPLLLPAVSSSTTLGPTQQDTVVKDGYVVKESLAVCSKPTRQLYCNELCSCVRLSHEAALTGWERCTGTLSSPHFVHPLPYAKLELLHSKASLTKLSGGSKTEFPGRLYKGYYEKTDIPFHFQHLDSASAHAELYREDHTYPSLEEWSGKDQCSSVSLSSVLEPKQLTLGVSKPGGMEPAKPNYSRMPHKLSEKRQHPSTHYHSLENLTTKSATALEVYHGQTSSLSLGNLPAPSDSPPSSHRTLDSLASHSVHFKDIINIDDSPGLGHRPRPSVRWASHHLPPSLLSAHKRKVESPRPGKAIGASVKRKMWASSQPRGKGTVHHGNNVSKHLGATQATLTKVTPTKQRKEPSTHHSEVPLGHVTSHVTHHVTRGRRKKQETSSVNLMPTSKALVPSLGVYTRTALAHNSLDHF